MNVPAANLIPAAPNAEPKPKDLETACRALEEAFATIVFRKMREAMVPKGGSGSSGFARGTMEGMLDAQWASLSSQGEGLGLWRTLYRQLGPEEVKVSSENADKKGTEGAARAAESLGQGPETAQPWTREKEHREALAIGDRSRVGGLLAGQHASDAPLPAGRKDK